MKNLFLRFASALTVAILLNTTAIAGNPYTPLPNGKYGYGLLASKGAAFWQYYVQAGQKTVFTAKNINHTSDIDLYIYADNHGSSLLDKSCGGGSGSELAVAEGGVSGYYVYIQIKNYGAASTNYQIYAHQVNYNEILSNALVSAGLQELTISLLCWLFDADCDNNSSNSDNARRTAVFVNSLVLGEDFKGATINTLQNEITTKIRQEMGYGFWADFAVNYSINVLRETYRHY